MATDTHRVATPSRLKRRALILLVLLLVGLGSGFGFLAGLFPAAVELQPTAATVPAAPPLFPVGTGPADPTTTRPPTAAPTITPAIDARATEPTVTTADGSVVSVLGAIEGTARWPAGEGVDRVQVVVSSAAADGWRPVAERTVDATGTSLDLTSLLGPSVRYLDAGGVDVPVPGPGRTATHEGQLAITVILFADGTERGRATRVLDYAYTVRGPASDTGHHHGTTHVAIAAEPATIALVVGPAEGTTGQRTVLPGDVQRQRFTVENRGTADGDVALSLGAFTDAEGTHTDIEREAGDATPATGELSRALSVRAWLERDGGTTQLLGADGPVPLSRVAGAGYGDARAPLPAGETGTLVLEWHVAPAATNAIQTDATSLNVSVAIEQRGSAQQ